jgi:NAD(P)-dependent dehydrogenase (short-subunit alcohol dehydrogenase family)
MKLDLEGKVALVTGASLGIGHAIAVALLEEGASVVLNARNVTRLHEVVFGLGSKRAVAAPGDMSLLVDVRKVVAAASEAFGQVDILVNNAGSTPAGRIDTLDDAVWEESLQLKLMGYVRCAREVLPAMRQRKWGRILNIIGAAGYQPSPTYLAGGVINASLLNFTKGLALDVAGDNVLVNGINPGTIRTPRWLGMVEQRALLQGRSRDEVMANTIKATSLGRAGTPEDVAGLVTFLCSERASYITGGLFDVDGGGRVGI